MKIRQPLNAAKNWLIRRFPTKIGFHSFADTEKAELNFYVNYLQPGMIAFDVGANIGVISLIFSRLVGTKGVVHSFEPSPETYKRFEKINEVSQVSNIILNNIALSDQNGMSKFYLYDASHHELNGFSNRPFEKYGLSIDQPKLVDVNTQTVDQYCRDHHIDNIDLLKIDVEGAEYQVIRGAKRMMSEKRIRCCIFEFGQTTFDMGNSPQQLRELLEEYGYSIHNLFPNSPIFPGGENALTAQFAMHVCHPKKNLL